MRSNSLNKRQIVDVDLFRQINRYRDGKQTDTSKVYAYLRHAKKNNALNVATATHIYRCSSITNLTVKAVRVVFSKFATRGIIKWDTPAQNSFTFEEEKEVVENREEVNVENLARLINHLDEEHTVFVLRNINRIFKED